VRNYGLTRELDKKMDWFASTLGIKKTRIKKSDTDLEVPYLPGLFKSLIEKQISQYSYIILNYRALKLGAFPTVLLSSVPVMFARTPTCDSPYHGFCREPDSCHRNCQGSQLLTLAVYLPTLRLTVPRARILPLFARSPMVGTPAPSLVERAAIFLL
jgi:hypothetical protein